MVCEAITVKTKRIMANYKLKYYLLKTKVSISIARCYIAWLSYELVEF